LNPNNEVGPSALRLIAIPAIVTGPPQSLTVRSQDTTMGSHGSPGGDSNDIPRMICRPEMK